MAFNFNISFGNNKLPNYVERDSSGGWWYEFKEFFNSKANKGFSDEQKKLDAVLYNPAALKILTYRADLYSQVKFNSYSNDKIKNKDFLYSYKKHPNPYQSWIDFHWDVSFWRDLGNAYVYVQNDVWYCLNPTKIKLTDKQKEKFNNLAFSDATRKQAFNDSFKYDNGNGDLQILKLSNLYILSDLSTSVSGNWLAGNSRLDALYQVVKNSELSLTAKNRNLFFTTKFLVSGQNSGDINSRPMSDEDQKSISDSLKGRKEIFASKHKLDVNQLVSNLDSLKLDDSYIADLSIIGNMYGMTKDVLDVIIKGSTHENKEKAIGAFVDYSIMPKVQQHSDLYENILGLEDIRGSFKHLPFNAVFEAEKINNTKTAVETLQIASVLGYDITQRLKDLLDEN